MNKLKISAVMAAIAALDCPDQHPPSGAQQAQKKAEGAAMTEITQAFVHGAATVLSNILDDVTTSVSITSLRNIATAILRQATRDLPHDYLSQSFVSRATFSIMGAESQAQIELEITAIIAEIEEWVKNNA